MNTHPVSSACVCGGGDRWVGLGKGIGNSGDNDMGGPDGNHCVYYKGVWTVVTLPAPFPVIAYACGCAVQNGQRPPSP